MVWIGIASEGGTTAFAVPRAESLNSLLHSSIEAPEINCKTEAWSFGWISLKLAVKVGVIERMVMRERRPGSPEGAAKIAAVIPGWAASRGAKSAGVRSDIFSRVLCL